MCMHVLLVYQAVSRSALGWSFALRLFVRFSITRLITRLGKDNPGDIQAVFCFIKGEIFRKVDCLLQLPLTKMITLKGGTSVVWLCVGV